MGRLIDLTGKKFGKLTVIERDYKNSTKKVVKWLCRCDCGNLASVGGTNLRIGMTKSCGCIHKARAETLNKTHGETGTRLYTIWKIMRQRCNNANNPSYKNYGGRGITICKEWDDFLNFKQWAVTNGYTDELSIDRIDNDGDYTPDNCRWTTRTIQCNNKRTNNRVTYNGETRTVAEWARLTGINYQTLQGRIHEHAVAFLAGYKD